MSASKLLISRLRREMRDCQARPLENVGISFADDDIFNVTVNFFFPDGEYSSVRPLLCMPYVGGYVMGVEAL